MFTMPAIHHSSLRTEDTSMGTMPLNALNGSSDALGCSDSSTGVSADQKGFFGSYFGSSLSDNHPYRPQDTGESFRDSFNKSLRQSDAGNPLLQRRRSCDLDTAPAKAHPRFKDRSFSVGEIRVSHLFKNGRFVGDVIDENELASSLKEQVTLKSSSSQSLERKCPGADSTSKSSQTNHKKKKVPSSDPSTTTKTAKLLEKIKDNINSSNYKHSRNRSEDSRETNETQVTSSKSGRSRQNKTRHQPDMAAQTSDLSNHAKKDKKLTNPTSKS